MNIKFKKTYTFSALLLTAVILSGLGLPSNAFAQKIVKKTKICIDNNNDKIVLKRKCKSPRFSEVTPSQLSGDAPTVKVSFSEFSISMSTIDDIQSNTHSCPDDTLAISGGASILSNNGLLLKTSIPRSDFTGWGATVQAFRTNATGTLRIYAVCATGFEIGE